KMPRGGRTGSVTEVRCENSPVAWTDRASRTPVRGSRARRIVRSIAPHGLVQWRERLRVDDRDERQAEALARAAAQASAEFSVEAAIDFLVVRGLEEAYVRAGSMPEHSLRFAGDVLRAHLSRERPLLA